jgi:hypothetical protein
VLLFPVAFLFFRKIKHNPVIFIKLQRSVKRFPGFAFEAFDDGGLAFG